MDFEPFKESDYDSNPYKPEKDRPLDRALIIIYEGLAVYYDHIGPDIDYYLEERNPKVDFFKEPNGVYIWEGKIKTNRVIYLNGEFDIDVKLDGTLRKATIKEWQAYINEEYLWDRTEWFLPGVCQRA
jgi:hypothetical protein